MNAIIPNIIAFFTSSPRYKPTFEWSNISYVHNLFRVYELICWRKYGVRPESSMIVKDGKVYYAFHTFEALCTHMEAKIRSFKFRNIKIPLKVTVPVFITTEGFPVFQSPYLFAIAYDNSASLRTNGTSGNSTQSFTTAGTNRFMAAGTMTSNNSVSATYNGSSLTISDTHTNSNGWELRSHYLVNPTVGANNFVANFSTGGGQSGWAVSSYSGCKQSGQPDSHATIAQTTTSPITLTTTVVENNSWLWGTVLSLTSGSLSASTGATQRQNLTGNGNNDFGIYDSNGTVAAGSRSMAVAIGGSITNAVGIIMSIAPSVGAEYIITAAQGAFALTGNVVLFHRLIRIIAAYGSFSLTGIDIAFKIGKGIVASTGSFILTGIDVALRFGGWSPISKNSSNYTNVNKNNSIWTNED